MTASWTLLVDTSKCLPLSFMSACDGAATAL
jgi:hypothetical protein